MAEKVSDFLLQRLSQWRVKRRFGYPGDSILGIQAALERHPDLFHFVQVRHEEMAAFLSRRRTTVQPCCGWIPMKGHYQGISEERR